MIFNVLISLVFCKTACFLNNPPDGFRPSSAYASWYSNVWAVYNNPCYKGTSGKFWRTVSKKQVDKCIQNTLATVPKVVTRGPFEDALIGCLKKVVLVKRGCPRNTPTYHPIEGSRTVNIYSEWYAAAFEIFNNPCYFRVVPNWAKVEKKKFLAALKTVNKQLGPVVKNRVTYERSLKNVLGLVNLWKRAYWERKRRGDKKEEKIEKPKGYPEKKKDEKTKTSSALPEATIY